MNESLPISVHILTWNSDKTLQKTLESVKNCKEILIIDGGSTDNTLAIANEYNVKIIPQREEHEQDKPITNFSKIRNKGLKYTTQPWILALDSDEEASKELMNEIAKISKNNLEPSAYWVPRRYVYDGTIITYASTYPNERIYFFHKDAVRQWVKPIHERVELNENIPLYHLKGFSKASLPSIKEFKEKNLKYLEIEIKNSKDKGWIYWIKRRLYHTLRSRLIALIKLTWIWLLPHKGKRMPIKHEFVRFWYAWKLIILTCPINKNLIESSTTQ